MKKIIINSWIFLFLSGCNDSDLGKISINIEIERKILSNGMTLILLPDPSFPVVTYQTWFRVGTVDEEPGRSGFAKLFEHLYFSGTKKFQPEVFFKTLEGQGVRFQATTSKDYTYFFETFQPKLLKEIIEIESDRMQNLDLSLQKISRAISAVFEERRLGVAQNVTGQMEEALWALALQGHSYSLPVGGIPQDLLKIDLESASKFYSDYYHPSNAVVVVSGNFNASEVTDWIEAAYPKTDERPTVKRETGVPFEMNAEYRLDLYSNVPSQRFLRGYRISQASNNDSYALDVLANILFEGQSSILKKRLIDELDWVTHLSGYAFTPTYPGLFFVGATLKEGVNTLDVEREVDRAIRKIQDQGVTDLEVKRAIRQLTMDLLGSLTDTNGMARLFGTIEVVLGNAANYEDEIEKYISITKDDVKRVADKYLDSNNRAIVVMNPNSMKPKNKKVKNEK